MKKIINIVSIVITIFLSGSCIVSHHPEDVEEAQARALIKINVLMDKAEEHDYIHTVRFVIFNNATTFPSVDVNQLIQLTPDEQDARKLDVLMEASVNPDKTIIIILNEPTQITPSLEKVISPAAMEKMLFLMDNVFNTNHTEPLVNGIPISGIATKIELKEQNNTEENAKEVEIKVRRTVARVELWLKTDGTITGELTSATTVKLSKSHDRGYLMGVDNALPYGQWMNVDNPAKEVVWNYIEPSSKELTPTSQFICAFYTPERTCFAADDTDKLVLDILQLSTPSGLRDAQVVLKEFYPEEGGILKNINVVERNNVYRIIGQLQPQKMVFEYSVIPWRNVGQGVIIDPQYYLRVNRDHLSITNKNESAIITAETNYDRPDTDRGFPKGITTGMIIYYDKDGRQMTANDGDRHDWLSVMLSGRDGDLTRIVIFTATKDLYIAGKGYYATVEVKAGNLTKLIKITRS